MQTKKGLKRSLFLFILMLTDCILINLSTWISLVIRYEFQIAQIFPQELENFIVFMPINTFITLGIFAAFRLYGRLWKYAKMEEAGAIVFACTVSAVLHLGVSYLMGLMIPRSCYIISGFLLILLTMGSRFFVRWITNFIDDYFEKTGKIKKRIMLIGAGTAGEMIISEIKSSKLLSAYKVVCIIDDNYDKVGQLLHGIKIVGTRESIPEAAKRYRVDQIVLAMPSVDPEERAKILKICNSTGCDVKLLPGIYQFVEDNVNMDKVRSVSIEDLLGREPVEVEMGSVMEYVKDKTVLVTGGGGSIGSELCRQIVSAKPKELIIFDVYENNAYDIQNELLRFYPGTKITTLIGSVRDTRRINSVMEKYHPDIVYHAAAHKHVPLMEGSPNESIKNNVFGTLKTAQAAGKYGVKRFVLISTDKAVNPTNIMGATKRMCEMIVQMCNNHFKTDFVAVRFGNVLGSNGSVIPLFERQIMEGGPVTVTDPEIIRYFMTIPEAVSLVLQAGAFAKGGEIFILDMGKPVKILDLAENLIRLSGYEPYKDIDIVFTGLRPGEKKFEELLMDEEGLSKTSNNRIFIGKPIDFNEEEFKDKLEYLRSVMMDDNADIRAIVKDIVPTYNYNSQEVK